MSDEEFFREVSLPDTKPINPAHLRDMLPGKQIGRLVGTFPEANPWGGSMAGLELTDSTRIVLMAQPTPLHPVYGARVAWSQFERLNIITPSMVRHFTRSRRHAKEEAANRMQERVEGQVVLGVMTTRVPNEWGGETARFELSEGWDLFMMAIPKATANFTANHVWRLRRDRSGRQVVYVVGNGTPRKRR